MPQFTCLQCGTLGTYKLGSTTGKFCSNQCSGSFKVAQTRERVLQGLVHERSTLKRFLINELGESCASCGLGPVWNGKPLSLQVDHIDGDSDNDMPANLRLLCPNCHTQTETFCARNRKDSRRNVYLRDYRKRNGHRC